MMKTFTISVLVILGLYTVAHAAPSLQYFRTMLPVDSSENVGTSTAKWDEGWFNSINVGSCTGCGGSTFAWPFTKQADGSQGTTTQLSLLSGLLVHGSTTVSLPANQIFRVYGPATDGLLYSQTGSATNFGQVRATDGSSVLTMTQYGASYGGTYGGTSLNSLSILESSGTNLMLSYALGSVLFVNGNNETMRLTKAGNLGLSTTSPWAKLSVVADLDDTNYALFAIASSTGGTSTSTPFIVLNTGNVGIGTTTPQQKLSIHGEDGVDAFSINTTAGAKVAAYRSNALGTGGIFELKNAAGTVLTTLRSDLTAASYINNSGNFGIGTTTPDVLLTVSGATTAANGVALRLTNTEAGTTASPNLMALQFNGFAGQWRARIAATEESTNTFGSQLIFSTNTGGSANSVTEKMRLDASGNVGIGTNSPSSYWAQAEKLVIAGASDNGMSIVSGTTATGRIAFVDTTASNPGLDSGGLITYDHAADSMYFSTAGSGSTARLFINSSGLLGIATSTPPNELDIFSTATTSVLIESNSATQGGCIVLKDTDGSGFTQVVASNGILTAKVHTGSLATCN